MVGINWACGHLPPLTEVLHRLPLLRPPVPPGGGVGWGGVEQVSGSRALSFLYQSRAGGVQGTLGRCDSFVRRDGGMSMETYLVSVPQRKCHSQSPL